MTATTTPCVIVLVTARPDGLYDVMVRQAAGDETLRGLSDEIKDNLLLAINNIITQQDGQDN